MDGFKKPYRPTKINVRKPGEMDDTLVKLYRQSEFPKESAAAAHSRRDNINEIIDSSDDDISDFINESEIPDETKIPEKKSAKKARQKAQKKAKREKKAKHIFWRIFFIILILAIIAYLVMLFFRPFGQRAESDLEPGDATAADEIYYSPLTGLESQNKNAATAAATCIMIENSVEARPQSGLKDAGVIYEAIAEGGITRFMAVYQDAKPQYIGPIRSARMTFVEMSRQYQCGYIHVGGATVAIETLRAGNGYRDLDGGWVEGKYVFRIKERWAPHNVYSNFNSIDEWEKTKGWTSSKFNGFARIKPDTIVEVEAEKRNATKVSINFSGNSVYNVRYVYDAATNKYKRYHAYQNTPHLDKAKDGKTTQHAPDVVIAMRVTTKARPKAKAGFFDHTTTGSGEAVIFQNGTATKATWKRATVKDELAFYDKDGEVIELNRGQVWISMYASSVGGSVSWSNK